MSLEAGADIVSVKLWLNSDNKVIMENDVAISCEECPCDPPSDSSASDSSSCGCGTVTYEWSDLAGWQVVENNCSGGGINPQPPEVIFGSEPEDGYQITLCCICDSSSASGSDSSDSSSNPCDGVTGLYSTGELTSSGSGCDFDDAWGYNVTNPNANWATPAGASWIGPVCDSIANPQPKDATYTYSLSFNIAAGTDLSCLKIYGQWSSDNSTTEVRVNGNVTGYSCGLLCLTSLHDYEFGSDVLQIGDNTIEFDVDNGPEHPAESSPTGFTASIHCKVDCSSGS